MDKYFHIGKEVLCMSTDLYSILGKQNILKFLDHLHTNIYITDVETDKIVYMNETMKTTFNINEPEGKICWQVLQSGMKSRCGFCKIDELLELGENHCCIWDEINTATECIYKNYDSIIKYNGKIYHIQDSTDVTEYMKLTESASLDELTGMLNRRSGKEKLSAALSDSKNENKMLTIALYDVNGLKQINDQYGHNEGDNLLRYIASVTKGKLSTRDFIFRLSGDEFVIVFYDEDKTHADIRMKDIQNSLINEKSRCSMSYTPSICYGLVEIYPQDQYTVSDIIIHADEKMYIQKRDYHIAAAQKKLKQSNHDCFPIDFDYNKDNLYEALTFSTDDYIFVGNMKSGVFRYSPKMVSEFGLPGEIVENAAAFWSRLVHPDDAKYFLESNQSIADGRTDYHNIEYRAKNVRGEWIWLRCRGKMIRDEFGVPNLFAGMIANLGKNNNVDHMTGLYNRFEFEETIKKYIGNNKFSEKLALMVLDMDSFKNINDLYDRSFGDKILRITGQKISSLLPSNAHLFRLDGDEFGLVAVDCSPQECKNIFDRIQHDFKNQQEHDGKKYYSTVSAGCAFYPDDADNYLDLMKLATYSLEHSKYMGKNQLTLFSPQLMPQKERNLELIELLRESIERGFVGFSIQYQPQVIAESGKLYGAEALARWRCSKYGDISPIEFIPILEKSGLIIQFGRWIFFNAASQCKAWCEYNSDFKMSINLSYLQLLDTGLVLFIENTLKNLELSPASIILELTETYLVTEESFVDETLNSLKRLGIQIAMDDFGVGYSSLASLKNTPADIVKIDKGFVNGIAKDIFNSTFIRSITELCHDVGKVVVLEGVETKEEYNIVEKAGLDLIQGYYFGKPVTAELFSSKFSKATDKK